MHTHMGAIQPSLLVNCRRKTHNIRVVSFSIIQGLTEDYSLGDSLSDSSGELFQRGRGAASVCMSFLAREYMYSSIHLG